MILLNKEVESNKNKLGGFILTLLSSQGQNSIVPVDHTGRLHVSQGQMSGMCEINR